MKRLKSVENDQVQKELDDLLVAAGRLEGWTVARAKTKEGELELSSSGDLSRQQVEQDRMIMKAPPMEKLLYGGLKGLGVEPAKPSSRKSAAQIREAIDITRLIDPASLHLFAGTSVGRDIANSCVFGLRDMLRRMKARGGRDG